MRIAYISLHWPRTADSGVGKKIAHQINLWQKAGHEVRFFMHMHSDPVAGELIPGTIERYNFHLGLFGRFGTEWSRMAACARLVPHIRRFQPDIIYLRWGMYVFPAHRIFSIAPVVLEINTNDVYQHGLLGTLYGLYNQMTRGIFLQKAAGLLSTSQELGKAPEFARFGKPTKVIANGFDLSQIEPLPAPKNDTPRLIFIGTPGLPWHGIDKLVLLAREFPDLHIDVIGYDHDGLDNERLPNLVLHGYLRSEEYLKILATVDVGIGTLALHRKGMMEASPLKTREYLAYGVPLVLSYRDTDLEDLESEFLLKIPNNEDNIRTHGPSIHEFAYKMLGKRMPRSSIENRIDSKRKEVERLEFFESILNQHNQ